MKLTEEALKHYWKYRKQIFNAPENQAIIKRFFWLSGLFDRINGYSITIDSKTNSPQIKITKNKRTYDISIKSNDKKGTAQNPSSDYFACVKDNVLTNGGLTGVQQMAERFSATGVNNLPQLITEIGCMLSGSEFNTDSNYFDRNKKFIQEIFPYKTPVIHEEFRIISNTITEANDTGTLTSVGQMRHPTLHLANNNYFYHVINIINKINSDLPQTLVLRWPDSKYYNNQEFQSNDKLDYSKVQKNQLDTLIHRFPYKFFYMWANKDKKISTNGNDNQATEDANGSRILHLIGLAAYRGLVNSDIKYSDNNEYNDKNFNQEFQAFRGEWVKFSNDVIKIIKNTKDTGLKSPKYLSNSDSDYDYINELSLLLSIVLSKPQEMVDTTELIESGNKALILWGPPGTGKTYTAKQIIRELLKLKDTDNLENYKFKENQPLSKNDLGCWSLVQFHPNYTYEDFIGGISPDLKQSNLSYTLKEGIFKKICDAARLYSNLAAAANYVNKAAQASYPLSDIKKAIASIQDALKKIENDKKDNKIDQNTYNDVLKDCRTIISEILNIAKEILQKIQPVDTNSVEGPANSKITSIDKIIDELNKIIDPNKNEESNPDFTSLGEQITKVGEIIDNLETQEKEANNQDSPSDNDTNRNENKECEKIYKKYNKKYILIIDEINRADLSAVFGELMYALEYRNEKITIPNFEEEFTIPDNVYIIGTMNSIDKSLVTFDLALRRRFSFYKVMPQLESLDIILKDYKISPDSLDQFLKNCRKLNTQITGINKLDDKTPVKNALMLGEDYQIGQAYFAKIKDFLETVPSKGKEQDIRPDHMQKLWSFHLLPLLEEYLGNQVEDADIKKKLKEIEKQFVEMDDSSNN